MSKRDFKSSVDLSFGESKSAIDPSFLDVDSTIFGLPPTGPRVGIQQIGIYEIMPDPIQPRRAIPSEVRRQWNGNISTIHELFDLWYDAIRKERGWPFPLDEHMLETLGANDRLAVPGPIESAFLQVIELALSIRREGLTNPITVIPLRDNYGRGNFYKLETGERRWLAYHLLNAYFTGGPDKPDEQGKWSKIPAREMAETNVWRQASENTARADLNAIARSRQLALLMMDLFSKQETNKRTFKPIEAFNSEREFYAQVVDLSAPHGKSEMILHAMGFKHRNAIKRYKDLLRLTDEIWRAADDTNCPESVLRDLINLTSDIARKKFNLWLEKSRKEAKLLEEEEVERTRSSNPPGTDAVILPPDDALKEGERLYQKTTEMRLVDVVKKLTRLHDGVSHAAPETKLKLRNMTAEVRRIGKERGIG
jgi:hypothetical protein